MRLFIYIVLTLLVPVTGNAQSFSTLLTNIQDAPEHRRQYLVDSFLTHVSRFPLIEGDSTAYILFQGDEEKVLLASDANSWSNTHSPLTRISSTNLWYRKEKFEPDARIDYKLIVGEQWILDPKNPYTAPSGFGPNSELRMPAYEPPAEIRENSGVPQGEILTRSYHSALLNNTRKASIYLPHGYHQTSERYPLVLFHDGPDYLGLGNVATILDNLIEERRIPPVIAVFLPAINRTEEYAGSLIAPYSQFVSETVLGSIDSEFRTRSDSRARAVIGASNGGHLALYQGIMYQKTFGNVGAQSSNVTPLVIQAYAATSSSSGRIYLDVGTYDIEIIISRVNSFLPILQNGGYNYVFREFHEGHSWGSWRAHIDDMLEFFFSDLLDLENIPPAPSRGMQLSPLAPNPARSYTRTQATFSYAQHARLSLYDDTGRFLKQLWSGHSYEGGRSFDIDTRALGPGLYFLTLDSPTGRRTRRLLIH